MNMRLMVEDQMDDKDKTKKQLIDELSKLRERIKKLEKTETKRKKTKEELRESEERYRAIFESLHDVYYRTDKEGRITIISPSVRAQTGYDPEDIIGHQVTDFYLNPSDREIFNTTLREVGIINDYEIQLKAKDGRVIEVSTSSKIIHGKDGSPVGVEGILRDVTEHKQVENRLKESEKRSQAWLENSPVCTKIVDLNFNLQFMSVSGIKDLKIDDITEYYGKPYPFHFYPDSFRIPMTNNLKKVKETGKIITQEASVVDVEGNELWYHSTLVPVNDDKGQLDYIMVVSLDTTERKKAEEKIRKINEHLQIAIDNMPNAYILWDSDLLIKEWNKSAERIFGYSKEEMLGKNAVDFIVPNDFRNLVKDVLQKLKVGEVVDYSEKDNNIRKDGKVISCQWFNTPLADEDGKVFAILTLAQDITERKQAAEELRESERNLSLIYDTVESVLFQIVIDSHDTYRFLTVNNTFLKATGLTTDQIIGKSIDEVIPEPSLTLVRNKYQEAIRTKTTVHWEETTEYSTGKKIGIVSITPAINTQGKCTHLIGSVYDITELRQAEEEKKKLESRLQHAQKMEAMGALAGGIAHDFNNILTPIIGYTELSLVNVEKESQLQRNLQEVYKAGIRAKDLVKQILTFSRKSEQEFQPLQLKLIVEEALNLIRASLPTTIEIHQDIQSDSIIIGDPSQIHQVLMNLCTNAEHAMQEKGGVLEVRLEDVELDDTFTSNHPHANPGTYVRLTVHDTGFGMTPKVLKQAFDPFFTTKEKGEGTGMGLAVVHGIVQSHGGIITAYSKLGKGSTFNVFIPIPEKGKLPAAQIEKSIPKGNEHILFVDDEEMITNMGKQMLESLGYKVTIKTNSVEALEYFESNPDKFDLIITDQTMPKLTGHELARKILKIRPNIPIILCTGFSAKINEKKALANGISAFLLKPLLKHTMAEAIREVLDSQKEQAG